MTFNQKILILGSETLQTDELTGALANSSGTVNYGLVESAEFVPVNVGYYHTSTADLSPGDIVRLSKHFDQIEMLDQDIEDYPHFKSLVTTLRLMQDLEELGVNTVYRDNKSAKRLLHWRNFLKENRSFCIWPFIGVVNDFGITTACSKSYKPLTRLNEMTDWKNDPNYNEVRNNMIAGTLMPDRCGDCYAREQNEGLTESARQFETLEWLQRLSVDSVDELEKIENPLLYEFRPSNKCNIMCRMCDDAHSHLIEKEWKAVGIPLLPRKFTSTSDFDKINFSSAQRIYWGGGEPTIMPEFYSFLEKCIATGHTDFELNIGTNAMKFSDKLVNLLDSFSKVTLSVSYDGYQRVNDYVRWLSDFDTMVDNCRRLRDRGHIISLQTVFSMWNVTRIHEIFEFYDREYPNAGLLVQPAEGQNRIFLPYNHPRPDLVVESMERCKQTKVYYANGRSIKSLVDLIHSHYSNPNYTVDKELLRDFYEFNDILDNARGSRLEDYIPELAHARSIID